MGDSTEMVEFTNLLSGCLDAYNSLAPCDSNTCESGFFCIANNCAKGRCDRCLNHIQWHPSPSFHYSCPRITFHYVLRFFNRFASEIAYVVLNLKDDYLRAKTSLNVVSLGCGPGSEVYGFIGALRNKAPHIVLNYQGFDLNSAWGTVQQMSKNVLAATPHRIDFYDLNMFGAYVGFQGGDCDMLVLNYLLSDAQKYYTDSIKVKFLEDIAQFVFKNNVRNILFNDNSYYGKGGLDTGVGMMFRLIKELRKWQLQPKAFLRYFPSDNYVPSTMWKAYKNERLLFPPIVGNTFDTNINRCKSKQILVMFS